MYQYLTFEVSSEKKQLWNYYCQCNARSHSWAHDWSPMTCHKFHGLRYEAARHTGNTGEQVQIKLPVWLCPCHRKKDDQRRRLWYVRQQLLHLYQSTKPAFRILIHTCMHSMSPFRQSEAQKKCLPERRPIFLFFWPAFLKLFTNMSLKISFQNLDP